MNFFRRDEPDEETRTRAYYREIFRTDAGRKVLAHMLTELGFFKPAITEEESILLNYAIKLLGNMQIWNEQNAQEITNSLLNIYPKQGGNEQ